MRVEKPMVSTALPPVSRRGLVTRHEKTDYQAVVNGDIAKVYKRFAAALALFTLCAPVVLPAELSTPRHGRPAFAKFCKNGLAVLL